MTYTEIKQRNGKKYYYRVVSIREKNKISKRREYLGANLTKEDLNLKERNADKKLKALKLRALEKIRPKIINILKKNKIKKAGIFGSYASGNQRKDSDVDIIVEPPKGIGFGFAGIQLELEKELNRKVDLVTYKYLSPYLKKYILEEEVRIIWRN